MARPRRLERALATGTVLFTLWAGAARAQDDEEAASPEPEATEPEAPEAPAEPAPAEASPDEEEDAFGHAGQFGVRAGLVAGYRMFFRYDDSPLCNVPEPNTTLDDQQSVCGFVAPLATEIALSFSPIDFVEPYAFVRLGFSGEDETDTDPMVLFGAGARLYTMSDSRLKLFIEPALGYQIEGGRGAPEFTLRGELDPKYKEDLIFHLGIGPQYDLNRNIGLFANAGLDVGVLRAIHATLLLNIGFQVRGP